MPFGASPLQLALVLVILLVIFGAKRLPEIGRSLGSSAREFKQGISGDSDDVKQGVSGDSDDDANDAKALSSSTGEEERD